MHKLNSLTVSETKALLHRYFGKAIDLKENDRKKDLLCSELEVPQLSVKKYIQFAIASITDLHESTQIHLQKFHHQDLLRVFPPAYLIYSQMQYLYCIFLDEG